jgi:hypothetical protein
VCVSPPNDGVVLVSDEVECEVDSGGVSGDGLHCGGPLAVPDARASLQREVQEAIYCVYIVSSIL